MSAAEIKKTRSELIDWIQQLSDLQMLEFLSGLKKREEKGDWWDTIPESHQQAILKGVEQIKNGRSMSSEEFWKRLKNG